MSDNKTNQDLYISTDIEVAIIQGDRETFNDLIDDANVAHRADNGNTLLHEAAGSGRPELAKELIDRGIDVDTQNGGGQTPLLKALELENYDVVKVLLDAGADPNILDNNRRSPLAMALKKGKAARESMKLLLECGADPTLPDRSGGESVDCVLEWAREIGKTEVAELMESYVDE